ncbi:MAG: hypothetical protein K2N56_05995 [Oscillospiraceae bacterium]|nr:hypothetical protein [Oscillospiraceae bacterium]
MTVGNTARYQFRMAQVQTKYGSGLDSLYGAQLAKKFGSSSTKAAAKSLEDLLKSKSLKNKSAMFREEFSNLYKNIYGITDEDSDSSESYSSLQSIKSASASAGGAAQSIKNYANGLKYGGEVDVDSYRAQAQSFVDSYNAMIDKVGNSDSARILQRGVLMTNTGKVYSSALRRAGITVGADNKLTVNDDLSKVRATDIKTVMGTNGFSDKVIQKAGQINSFAGGNGIFTAGVTKPSSSSSSSSSTDKVDNSGTLKELTAAVKDAATELKSYASNLGSEDKKFVPTDFTDTANKFIEKYNTFIDEMNKSDKSSVQQRGNTLQSVARSYKYSLNRVGINVDENGKLSISEAIANKITEKDVKYSFGGGGFADKVIEKADQVKSLVSSASAMGYNADKTATYAYNSGALYSVYA